MKLRWDMYAAMSFPTTTLVEVEFDHGDKMLKVVNAKGYIK